MVGHTGAAPQFPSFTMTPGGPDTAAASPPETEAAEGETMKAMRFSVDVSMMKAGDRMTLAESIEANRIRDLPEERQ